MKNKKIFFIIFTFILFFILLSFTSYSYGADSKLVNTIKKAFEQIQDWLLKLATPAAAVAVRCWCIYEKIQFR